MEMPAVVHDEAGVSECVNVVHTIALCDVQNQEDHKEHPSKSERLECATPGQASE